MDDGRGYIEVEGATAMEKLADLEDAEEQGRLIVLPCKAGDEVYAVHADSARPIPKTVRGFVVSVYSDYGQIGQVTGNGDLQPPLYLSREEAEKEAANV